MKADKIKRYLERNFDAFLTAWKQRADRLPLLIKGARQVGKTAAVRHFAVAHYASFIEINFVERPEFKLIAQEGFAVDKLIRNISLIETKHKFIPGNTLIFFDELQDFPEIATAFKFFSEDGRFDVIGSGSLLGIQFKRVASFSVGYQEQVVLRSLDFGEFLRASGYSDAQLEEIFATLCAAQPFSATVMTTFSRLFLDYCVLGGMPEVLESYFVRGAFERVPAIQKRLLDDYRNDIRKYAEGLDPLRIQSVFDSVPGQLAKENHKFQLSLIASGARRKDYWGCVEWLLDAGVVNRCPRLRFPEIPIMGNLDPDAYKLYMADSGLLLAMLDTEAQEDLRLRRNLGTWKGGLYENIVAEALVKAGAEPVYFKKDNATLELDFLMRAGEDLVPIEVKAGNASAKSLRTVIASDHYPQIRWGVKLHSGNNGWANQIFTMPQWCAFWLPRFLRERARR